MHKLPVIFGYAGVLPFLLFMLLSLFADTEKHVFTSTILHMAYATIILSFLGGVHWGQALPSGNQRQLSFAMVPSITGFALMAWAIWMDPSLPLLGAALLFWIVYKADQKFMPADFIPEGYFVFRRNLTIIVISSLIISFLATI